MRDTQSLYSIYINKRFSSSCTRCQLFLLFFHIICFVISLSNVTKCTSRVQRNQFYFVFFLYTKNILLKYFCPKFSKKPKFIDKCVPNVTLETTFSSLPFSLFYFRCFCVSLFKPISSSLLNKRTIFIVISDMPNCLSIACE